MRRLVLCTLLSGLVMGFCVKDITVGVAASQPGAQSSKVRQEPGLIARVEALEKAAVKRGMMLPYFGKDLPDGFVWADGKRNWPSDAGWLPAHLRGAPVPDMREYLVGGAEDETSVGKVWQSGKIGGGQLKPISSLSQLNETFELKPPRFPNQDIYGMIGEVSAGPDRDMEFRNVERKFTRIQHPKYSALAADLSLPTYELNSRDTNPRHVMCRWIIRIQ